MRITNDMPGTGGVLLANPEDFVVEETLPYQPQGDGGHLFLHIQKQGVDTLEAAKRITSAIGLLDRKQNALPVDIGIAGLKDKYSIAKQWLSIPWSEQHFPELSNVNAQLYPEVQILRVVRHPHKLRRGHVLTNHFSIFIRKAQPQAWQRAANIVEQLKKIGVPNRYGPQRFGRFGDNAERAKLILKGDKRRPRDKRLWSLLASALQAEIFNQVLAQRLLTGLLLTPLLGDRMVKHATGGQFLVDDPQAEQKRIDALEISPMGPIFGKKTPNVKEQAAKFEQDILDQLDTPVHLLSKLGPGSRRALRFPLDPQAQVLPTEEEDSFKVSFSLPAGSYATVVLDEIIKPEGWFQRTDTFDSQTI